MAAGKMKTAFLKLNSVIISTDDQVYFNQIKGKNMQANFLENKLQNLDVQSNGKAVYYATDNDKKYMGVNDVDCSDMFMTFLENQIQRIKFTGEPKAVLYPMGMTNHTAMRIKEFKWLEDKRPKSKFEITGNRDWSYRLAELSGIVPLTIIDSVKTEQDTIIPVLATPDSLKQPNIIQYDPTKGSGKLKPNENPIPPKEEKKPTVPNTEGKLKGGNKDD